MNYLKLILLCFVLNIAISCSVNSPVDLIESQTLNPNRVISYQTDIKPIMTSNCTSCHGTIPSNNAPMSLNDLASVKTAILSLDLVTRINLPSSNGAAMPLGAPKLLQSQIDLIVKWQNEGFAN